ncbi:MAG: hypothetical protein UR56_C0008G0004 [Candidatus Roizmanbacteria bacterium GW2011_GWC2_34_23]|uniref:Uncharacterized protein n=1 Tax=Candidatus Roizmanbacteria bacterium GW2011_GWC2_34_23 TaxID=1618484 RepID=A0A0G0DEP8_9BACT|nr:MAG: hypothetical protein UR56_C0008G0004 [Candidatus Roizmanbacteria bacterium GW2011_GWC2_34_23]
MIYLDMKKIFLTLLLLFIFFSPKITFGQDFSVVFTYKDNIPGLTCGIAGDVTGKDKCCNLPKSFKCDNKVIEIISGLGNIPLIGGSIQSVADDYTVGCGKMMNFIDQQTGDTACLSGEKSPVGVDSIDPSCKCVDKSAILPNQAMIQMCSKYLSLSASNLNELKNCINCANGNGMWTGMGCLPLDLNTLITSFILTTGIGLGGGFALLCIIYAAFMMQSSQGNPEKLKKAQEMITSCIMGLMLIIFSVFIMKLIGVNILRIPGFG